MFCLEILAYMGNCEHHAMFGQIYQGHSSLAKLYQLYPTVPYSAWLQCYCVVFKCSIRVQWWSSLLSLQFFAIWPWINRPGVATFVINSITNLLIQLVNYPLCLNLPGTVYPKPEELASWNFERMYTPNHVSQVMCEVSGVRCHISSVRC